MPVPPTDGLTEAHHKNIGRIPAELVVQTITSWKTAEVRVNGQASIWEMLSWHMKYACFDPLAKQLLHIGVCLSQGIMMQGYNLTSA